MFRNKLNMYIYIIKKVLNTNSEIVNYFKNNNIDIDITDLAKISNLRIGVYSIVTAVYLRKKININKNNLIKSSSRITKKTILENKQFNNLLNSMVLYAEEEKKNISSFKVFALSYNEEYISSYISEVNRIKDENITNAYRFFYVKSKFANSIKELVKITKQILEFCIDDCKVVFKSEFLEDEKDKLNIRFESFKNTDLIKNLIDATETFVSFSGNICTTNIDTNIITSGLYPDGYKKAALQIPLLSEIDLYKFTASKILPSYKENHCIVQFYICKNTGIILMKIYSDDEKYFYIPIGNITKDSIKLYYLDIFFMEKFIEEYRFLIGFIAEVYNEINVNEEYIKTCIENSTYNKLSNSLVCNLLVSLGSKKKAILKCDTTIKNNSKKIRLEASVKASLYAEQEGLENTINSIKNTNLKKLLNKCLDQNINPELDSFKLKGKNIIFRTKPIYFKEYSSHINRTGNTFFSGVFDIILHYNSTNFNEFTIFNRAFTVRAYDSHMQHPHTFSHGSICQGEWSSTFAAANDINKLDLKLRAIIDFLNTAYILDSAGKYLGRWPLVGKPKEDEFISLAIKEANEKPLNKVTSKNISKKFDLEVIYKKDESDYLQSNNYEHESTFSKNRIKEKFN